METVGLSREAAILLEAARSVRQEVMALGDQGRRAVGARPPGYRSWDPDVLQVDLAAESRVLQHLRRLGEPAVVLSEEAGRMRLDPEPTRDGGPNPREPADELTLRVVVDPFDGSLLYRRDLPFLWAVGLGLWRGQRHRASCVADLVGGTAWLADGERLLELTPDGRLRAAGPGARPHPSPPPRLQEAYVATYLMKPHYLSLALRDFAGVLRASRFVVPIGGPLAWVFLATGRIDAYLAHHQPLTEVYSAMGLAIAAGCVVTDLQGQAPRLVDDAGALYTLVATRHPALHQQLLEEVVRGQAVREPAWWPED